MVNDRLHHFINVLGMNPSAFAESVDTNAAVIFNIVKGRRSKPSFDLLEKIFDRYDKLNSEWLMTGEGTIWKEEVVTSGKVAPSSVNLENRITELLIKLRLENTLSYETEELDELVGFLIRETNEQKQKLILMYDRQKSMVKMLKKELKIKDKS
ncbi:MAG: hypothetical protein AB8B73_11420 [Ekhidna sp.]